MQNIFLAFYFILYQLKVNWLSKLPSLSLFLVLNYSTLEMLCLYYTNSRFLYQFLPSLPCWSDIFLFQSTFTYGKGGRDCCSYSEKQSTPGSLFICGWQAVRRRCIVYAFLTHTTVNLGLETQEKIQGNLPKSQAVCWLQLPFLSPFFSWSQ